MTLATGCDSTRPSRTVVGGSAATRLGDQGVGLQLIMAKTRHRSARTAMRYVKPSAAAVAEVTELLDIAPRRA